MEFFNGSKYLHRTAQIEYYALVEENGDVTVGATFDDDNGFVQSHGRVFSKIIRPFSDIALHDIEERKKFELAREVYFKRQAEAEIKAILEIKEQMFKKDLT